MERGIHLKESVFLGVINEWWYSYKVEWPEFGLGVFNSEKAFICFDRDQIKPLFKDTDYRFQYDMKNDQWTLKPKENE